MSPLQKRPPEASHRPARQFPCSWWSNSLPPSFPLLTHFLEPPHSPPDLPLHPRRSCLAQGLVLVGGRRSCRPSPCGRRPELSAALGWAWGVRQGSLCGRRGAACLAQPGCLRLGARAWSGICVAAELAGRSRPRSQCLRSAASRAMFLCSMPQAKPCSSKAQARRAPTLPSEGSCPRPRGHHTSPPSTDRCRRAVSLRSCTERWPPSTARTGEPHGPGPGLPLPWAVSTLSFLILAGGCLSTPPGRVAELGSCTGEREGLAEHSSCSGLP